MDNAVYVDGVRIPAPPRVADAHGVALERGGIVWVDLAWPTSEEIGEVAEEFSLHHLAVEDAINVHQRPKIERYDEALFVVLHPARNLDEDDDGHIDRIELGTVHAWVGSDFVVTIRRSEVPDLTTLRDRLEDTPGWLRHGSAAILVTLLDLVVDTYLPVVTRLRADIDLVEDQLFLRNAGVSLRIYEATREVIELQRATQPLVDILRTLQDGEALLEPEPAVDPAHVELRRHLRNVLDHAVKYAETSDTYRSLLVNALDAHSTLVTQEQNEQTKQISAWAAILFAPTLIGTIYGMNFDHMPELHWLFGYPLALAAMVGLGAVLYRLFKRVGWL